MIDFLPLFPLKLVAFPGEQLNLHIFEPRYKQLFRECEENQITFGIPAFIDNKIMDIGTELKLEKKSLFDPLQKEVAHRLEIYLIHCRYQCIDLKKVDAYIVGDLCLGQPAAWPPGEQGYARHFDPSAKCQHSDETKR